MNNMAKRVHNIKQTELIDEKLKKIIYEFNNQRNKINMKIEKH